MAGDNGQSCRRISLQGISALCYYFRSGFVICHGPKRKSYSEKTATQFDEVSGPTDRHGHVADGVFQNEIPADDPSDNFTECRIRIGVSRAGDGNHGGEFGVTKRGKAASNCSNDKRKDYRRTGAGAAENDRSMG